MKHQALICLIAIQAFICTGTLLGVEPVIAGAIDDVAVGHAKTAVYVVDQAADMNPGTEQMPFKTVQSAADAAKPGDTIYVMAGRYDKLFKVKAGGTESKPVAFVAMPRREIKTVHVDCFQTFTNNGKNPLFVDSQKRDFRLRPGSSAVGTVEGSMTARAMKGEKVTISGTDLIEGWNREADGSWSATLGCTSLKLSCATKASI